MAASLGVGSLLEEGDVPLANVTEELPCSTPADDGTRPIVAARDGATELREEPNVISLTASDDVSAVSSDSAVVRGEGDREKVGMTVIATAD